MRFSNKYFSSYLQFLEGIFEKIKKFPDFLAVIADYGYDDARIQEGRGFYTDFSNYHRAYLQMRQTTLSKAKALSRMFKRVFTEYCNYVKRLRMELKSDLETGTALGVKGNRERRYSSFIDQSTNFYDMALKEETLPKIQTFGLTTAKLQSGLKHVEEFSKSRFDYESMRGECQELVEKRYKAYVKSRDWISAFITSCKVAYADDMQTLEKLGIFVLNRPRIHEEEEEAPEEVPGLAAAPAASTASPAPTAPTAKEGNVSQVAQVTPASEPAK